jgi:DNA-binding response OmpR family regulator
MNILIAEDDIHILEGLCEIFEGEGFHTIKARNGTQALDLYKDKNPDFVCLDIMMPDVSGYDVCRQIREQDPYVPIIFITAKAEEIDKVLGLELGADDYIVKPFGLHEVVARIRAVTRRYMLAKEPGKRDDFFTMGSVSVYPAQLKAKRGDKEIDLSLRDVKILKLLHDHKNDVVDRNKLLDECWGQHIMPESRTVDQHISQLRKRIEKDPQNPAIIQTVHGVGYRYEEEEETSE